MIGLVIVTHGRLAVEFRAALEHVVGPQSQIEAITIGPDDNGEQCRKNIIEAVKRVDTGDGVAILTDMFGGTPSNLAISVMSRPKVEVLAGINLPMLVKLAKVRGETSLPEAVAHAPGAGPPYLNTPIASRVLAGKLLNRALSPTKLPTRPPGRAPWCASSASSTRRACTPALRPNSSSWWRSSTPTCGSSAPARASAGPRSWD